ncbi:MAG: NAD(P)/FAD-dependent oxidoreductase [Thiolinea sp.]
MSEPSRYPASHHFDQTSPLPAYPVFSGNGHFDVCVIGGGYTGLSSALHLAELGYRVALLEAKCVGWGASGRNGGQLGYGMAPLQQDLIRRFGEEAAKHFWDISVAAVDLFHDLCGRHSISCDFRPGNMACAVTASDYAELRQHAEIVAGYGENIYQLFDPAEAQKVTGSPVYQGAILAQKAGHINPLKYALGLAQAAEKAGVRLFENSVVKHINFADSVTIDLEGGRMTADYAVIACNGYLGALDKTLAKRILPIANYQMATAPLDEVTLSSLLTQGMCVWDTSRSVHYFRLTPDQRLVMGGGISVPGYPPRQLEKDCRKHLAYVYPQLKDVALDFIWGGTVAGTRNQLPDVGRLAPNVFYAQGYTGHGVALAPLMGKYIAAAIQGESAEFDFMAAVKHKPLFGGRLLRVPAVLAYRFLTNTLDQVFRF